MPAINTLEGLELLHSAEPSEPVNLIVAGNRPFSEADVLDGVTRLVKLLSLRDGIVAVYKDFVSLDATGIDRRSLVVLVDPLPEDMPNYIRDSSIGLLVERSNTALLPPAASTQGPTSVPIITSVPATSAHDPFGIWLIGFESAASNLEEVLAQIAREFPICNVHVESTADFADAVAARIEEIDQWIRFPATMHISIELLSTEKDSTVSDVSANAIIVFYNDPKRTALLEKLCWALMGGTAAVAFTKFMPFPSFIEPVVFIEDVKLSDLAELGAFAQAELVERFGERPLIEIIDRHIEAFNQEDPLATDRITHLLTLTGREFIDAAYRVVLGRSADAAGREHYLDQLAKGVDRETVLAIIGSSTEARAITARLPGLDAIINRYRRSTSRLGWVRRQLGLGIDHDIYSRRALRVLENRLARALETQRSAPQPDVNQAVVEPAPVPNRTTAKSPAMTTTATTLSRPAMLLVAGTSKGTTSRMLLAVAKLERSWSEQGIETRIVIWSDDDRRFRLVNQTELDTFRLTAQLGQRIQGYPTGEDLSVLVEPFSCQSGDWIVVPDTIRTLGDMHSLVEVDVVMEARRLRVRCAFLFHGADPLYVEADKGQIAAVHEQYMQALLLADAVVADSKRSMEDLNDFLVEYQLADSVPILATLTFPAFAGSHDNRLWRDYARQLSGLLKDAASNLGRLRSVYFWHDDEQPNAFETKLAEAIVARGIKVISTTTNADKEIGLGHTEGRTDASLWTSWIEPNSDGAPDWLIVPDTRSVQLPTIISYAASHGLRIAGLLHEALSPAADTQLFETIVKLDKILTVSEACYEQFYALMLGSRSKLHNAEHRFKLLKRPFDVEGVPKAVKPKTPGNSVIGLVRLSGNTEADRDALAAIVVACERASPAIGFVVAGNKPRNFRVPAGVNIRFLPAGQKIESLLNEADFLVLVSDDCQDDLVIASARWRGLPCLLPAPLSGNVPSQPGVVFADTRNTITFSEALARFAQLAWRRSLAWEAIDSTVRSWDDYARDILTEIATDRPSDLIQPGRVIERGNILERFPNLSLRPKLSVCISTYNRGGWVALGLRNIFAQIPNPRADLEILVVDNTSTDNTAELVSPFIGRSDFRYIRNPRNVGMLGNLAVTAQRARGEYIWILGDDDLTRPGVIESILLVLKDIPELALIYMNYGYSTEGNPANVDINSYLSHFNYLQPPIEDEIGEVRQFAAKTENFYTAIWSHIYRRDHAMRSYCQDTSGRTFSSMLSCIPTTHYVLTYMANLPAYWIGDPALVVNANVSWVAYAPLFELEQFPRGWDLAEQMGCPAELVDQRRSDRLWMVEHMWRELFENDAVGNGAYVSAPRIIMRLKHLPRFDEYVGAMHAVYCKAYDAGHVAAQIAPEALFAAWPELTQS